MDGPPYGYILWHSFIRAVSFLDLNTSSRASKRWLEIDRHLGLAAAIDFTQNPKQSDRTGNNPNNPQINSNILEQLRARWLSRNYEQLDEGFDKELGI